MKLVQIYRCLCDETRLRILHLLKQGPLCVCHFQEILQLPQVAVSKHLAYLRRTGMVEARRHEQWMIYSLPASPCLELSRQLSCLQDCVQTEAVFRKDLRRLKALGPKCNWVPKAMGLAHRRHGAISQEVEVEFGSNSSPRRGGCCG